MNKQRKVVITVTYNELGVIVDTKAEELDSSAQPEIVYCKDCICGHGEVWLSGNGSADLYGYCGRTQLRVVAYDYCSYAERRADD